MTEALKINSVINNAKLDLNSNKDNKAAPKTHRV